MSDINDGGPAFPETGSRGRACGNEGMTLRDYFAAKAMAAMISNQAGMECFDFKLGTCVVAYEMADAMLKAREAK